MKCIDMRRSGWYALASVAVVASALAQPPQGTAPFTYTDEVVGEYVSYNSVPRRPMVIGPEELNLYAVNTHGSTVLDFDDPSGTPAQVFDVPRFPVSIGLWNDPRDVNGSGRLVVVCDGDYCLVLLDRATGEILELLELRDPAGRIQGEPADLLIDQDSNRAFVSCTAADSVLEIDLLGPTVVRKFDLPGKNPVFLCFDEAGDVLVAPQLSGNNSGARQSATNFFSPQHQGPTVVDFATQAIGGGLPDRDLFRCVRSSGAVEAVTTAVGTVCFAVGVNPVSHRIWQLNTEANNKNANFQGEAAIQGNIVQNRLSIAIDPGQGQPPNAPVQMVDLDLLNPTLPYDPTRTVGQPYSLSWIGGYGIITGLLTDNVTVLDNSGAFVLEFDLPDGSIPRGTAYSPMWNLLFVYCWGTNTIRAHTVTANMPLAFELDLGYDPAPEGVKAGREIFYDAAHSERNNASCASCHVDGGTDLICWNLNGGPADDKGPMLTQTLFGIQRIAPFHWRGEQQLGLIDFNPAFVNLLGAPAELSSPDFALFEEFVFSMQNRPNPFSNEERLVDDALQPPLFTQFFPPGNATSGQVLFETNGCERCHSFPMSTNNDIVGDGAAFGEQNPRRQFFKIASFQDIYKREQDTDKTAGGVQTVTITLPGLGGGANEIFQYPLLGAASSHAGLLVNLNEFVFLFNFPPQETSDLTSFIYQWDQGIAPATYRATLLDQAHFATASTEVSGFLVPQADARNCDLAVFGISTLGGALQPMRWFYDPALLPNPPFVPEDTTQPNQDLAFFLNQAQNDEGRNVFAGVPVGVGRRFGIDFDGDDLLNADEAATGTDPYDPDFDLDGWPDGHEVLNGGDPTDFNVPSNDVTSPAILSATTPMVVGKVARINVETDEPCTVEVTYMRAGGPQQSTSTTELARTHSVLIDDLLNSTGGNPWITYTGAVIATDIAGHSVSVGLPDMPAFNQGLPGNPPLPITTRNFQGGSDQAVIGNLRRGPIAMSNPFGSISTSATVRVDQKIGGPPPVSIQGVQVVARILVNGVPTANFGASGGSLRLTGFDFKQGTGSVPFTGLPGPFLLSPVTSAAGSATLTFNVSGLTPGDVVTLNIELVVRQDPSFPTFTVENVSTWNMPSTPKTMRSLRIL